MANVGNWIVENTATIGTGSITLGGAPIGFARFIDAVPSGDVWYVIEDGGNKEAGVGVFNGANLITRSDVRATFVNGTYDDSNPTPINLSGTSQIACTFNASAFDELFAHLNTTTGNPHNVLASQIPYDASTDTVTDEVDVQSAMLDHADSIEQRVASMSGIVSGGMLSGGAATFNVSAGNGAIFDSYTDPSNTDVTEVTWLETNGIPIEFGESTTGSTRIFMSAAGVVVQITGPASPSNFREYIFLGAVYFLEGVITEITNAPSVIKQTATDTYDALRHEISVSGSQVKGVTNELQVWTDTGTLFYPGVNWYVDNKNPNVFTLAAQGDENTPIEFYTMTQTGLIAGPITTLPKRYNPSGDTLTNLGGNDACIHRLYSLGIQDATRKFIMLYGQNEYTDPNTAKSNILTDTANTTFPAELSETYLLALLGVGDDADEFDGTDAWIVNHTGTSGGSNTASNDHTNLANRDATNQHPIESVGVLNGEQLRDSLDAKTQWFGSWEAIEYQPNSMVIDGDWTMIANTVTTDRAAPQITYPEAYVYGGTLTDSSVTATSVLFGTRYTLAASGYLNNYRLYAYAGQTYVVYAVQDPTGTPVSTVIANFTAGEDGWVTLGIYPIILGDEFDIYASVTSGNASIKYGVDIDYWDLDPEIFGLYAVDDTYANISVDSNAYGIDINVQSADVSADWDIVARSGGGVSGSGTGGNMIQDRQLYTNVAGQVEFPVTYDAPNVFVYLNGSLVSPTNYTASNGTSVLLNEPIASASDELELISYIAYTATDPEGMRAAIDVYSKEETDNGRKNLLMNGDFSIWQRGNTFNGIGYTADRWYSGTSANQVDRASGLGVAPAALTVSNTAIHGINQYIELPYAGTAGPFKQGSTVTASMLVKGVVGEDMTIEMRFSEGSSGTSGTKWAPVDSITHTGTGDWERVSTTFTVDQVPSGTDIAARLQLTFFNTAGATQIAEAKVETGSVATPFTYQPAGDNLAACQRYTRVIASDGLDQQIIGLGFAVGATSGHVLVNHEGMRAVPEITQEGQFDVYTGSTANTMTNFTPQDGSVNSTRLQIGSSGLTTGAGVMLRVSIGTSNKLIIDAEL